MRTRTTLIITLISASLLVACLEEPPPLPPLEIERIEVTEEPIESDKPVPEFKTYFGTGVDVIYSYVWINNADTMTGSFPVRMTWFSPSDLSPPIARRDIELEPGQGIAQFSIHNEGGMRNGPYKLIGRAGKSTSELTASGSKRFFVGMTPEEADEYLEQEAERLYCNTNKAIMASVPGTAFGDIAFVPGPWVKDPRGVRDVEEWYISLYARRKYIFDTFALQCQTSLKNLELAYQAMGDKIQILMVSGTDFGTQRGPLIGSDVYRELFKPFNKKVNDWIHQNTNWKCFQHCCGSVEPLIPEFIEAGFDILNPIQYTTAKMDPATLKAKYGERICFWGGGIDTQKLLPFGTPEQVYEQTRRQVEIFKQDGGYVFTPVHNIQPNTPVENILAMLEAFREAR